MARWVSWGGKRILLRYYVESMGRVEYPGEEVKRGSRMSRGEAGGQEGEEV